MADQAPIEETPDNAAADATQQTTEDAQTQQQIVDWEKRYNDLRPQYDRTTQEAAQYRSLVEGLHSEDPDTRRQAAEALGLQLTEEDAADEFEQVEQPLTRAEFEQFLREQQNQAQEQERAQQVRQIVDAQLQEWGLDEEDGNDVLAYAIHALPRTDEGLPDVWAAYERFQQRETARQKAWRESKRAPHMSPVGTSGTQTPNLDNRQERQEWMANQLLANEQA